MSPFDVLAILFIAYEATGIIARRRDWTVSDKFWNLRKWKPPFGRMLNDAGWTWVFFHLVIDPAWGLVGTSWVDLAVVAFGAGAGLLNWGRDGSRG